VADEGVVVARFAARVNALGSLWQASPQLQTRLMEEVKAVARSIDVTTEAGASSGYGRRVMEEAPGRWTLAVIVLRFRQQTHPHNHDGWGCAVTVQGIERDRRFLHGQAGDLILSSERDYRPGTGYFFDPADIHQPVGADPQCVTVALHFLVHEHHAA
jgi:predicted metal-dependent enzyme (double-stranded beta helix superfamily)